MGGANAGEVASSIAIETIQQAFHKQRLSDVVNSDTDIEQFLIQITRDADKAIVKHSKKNKETKGMGTTLVMVWVMGSKAYICWCGDSRCYVFNPEVGLTRLSKDHSLVQQLVDKGELSPENAHNHPMSNIITQCLGNTANKICPDTRVYELAHNDVLLLCTDGLCGLCTDDEIMQVMASNEDIVAMKGLLIEEALKAGGYDNVTVAICHIDSPTLKNSRIRSESLRSTLRNIPDDLKEEDASIEENPKDESPQMVSEDAESTLIEHQFPTTEKTEEQSVEVHDELDAETIGKEVSGEAGEMIETETETDSISESSPQTETAPESDSQAEIISEEESQTETAPEANSQAEKDSEDDSQAEETHEVDSEADADAEVPQKPSHKWWPLVVLIFILMLIAAVIAFVSPQVLNSLIQKFFISH
jgi:serine/threonine protein phosphatase PrpC